MNGAMYSPTIGFGLVPAGQPINLNPNKLSDTKFAFIVNNEKRVNHVVVFLSAPLLRMDMFFRSSRFCY